MTDFRTVNAHFSVAPQIGEADIEAAAGAGFTTIICNRPDGEDPEAPTSDRLAAKATSLGLAFHHLPFSGPPPADIVAQQGALIDASEGPVLAYCRSGTRSITAWALAAATAENVQEVIKAGANAGYDLSALAQNV